MDTKEEIFHEDICSISMIKVFHLYQRRNEWVDWDGETGLVSRSKYRVELTSDNARELAERNRRQGSKFFIDEIPALKISTKSGFVVTTELFTQYPLKMFRPYIDKTSNELDRLFKNYYFPKWFVRTLHSENERTVESDSIYFSRESSPAKSLCWTLKHRVIDEYSIRNAISIINKRIALE